MIKMKVWILHDSHFGNGKLVAETLGDVIRTKFEVEVQNIKDIKPEKVANEKPDGIIIGTAIRAFMISRKSKNWLTKFQKKLITNNHKIKYGAVFMTHGMGKNKFVNNKGNSFIKFIKKKDIIDDFYEEWISGKVKEVEGPLEDYVLEYVLEIGKKITEWMK